MSSITSASFASRDFPGGRRRKVFGLSTEWMRQLRFSKGKAVLLAACVALLGYFVIYPFAAMLLQGLLSPSDGSFTLDVYSGMLTDSAFYRALGMTFTISLGTLAVSLAMAVPMAWGVSRTDMPLRSVIRVCVILTFATPSFLGAIAWVLLLGPSGGDINIMLRDLFDLDQTPFNIFSTGGIIFVFSLYLYPYIFFAVTTALDNLDPAVEEAAAMLGAGTLRTSLTITLPMVGPAILAGGALILLESTVNFGVPAIIGLPVHIETLTTRIYSLFQFPPQYELAAATALPIVFIVAFCVLLQKLAVGKRSYVAVSGSAGRRAKVKLGVFGYLISGLSILIIGASIVLPFVALLVTSIKRTFGNPIGFDNITLHHFINVLSSSVTQRALGNSIMLAAGAAIICMFLATILSWIVERSNMPGRSVVSFLVMACFSLPGIALAVALIYAFSTGVVALYGTMWILLLSYSIHGLPVVFNYARIGLRQVNGELSDAAEILGAGWRRAFCEITVPLIKNALLSGGLIVFVLMMREFGSSVLLAGAGNEVVAVIIYEFAEEGDNGRMAALALIVFVVNLAIVVLANKLRSSWTEQSKD